MSAQRTYPIALACGIARFDFITDSFHLKSQKLFGDAFNKLLLRLATHGVALTTDGLHYFKNIQSFLNADGFDVHHTRVGFASSLTDRARDLHGQVTELLAKTKAKKVHIIAHSMGGLDARAMIARLGMADRVASLTTIGTPHLGTTFADTKLQKGGAKLIDAFSDAGKALDFNGFQDLTRDACRKFNEEIRNTEATTARDVYYQTYATSQGRKATFIFLQRSWDVITPVEGENDGLVSLTSQAWQPEIVADDGTKKKVVQKKFPVAADHLNQVGWWDFNELHGMKTLVSFNARDRYENSIKEAYRDIARDLRARFPI